jgi:hypothetical protein
VCRSIGTGQIVFFSEVGFERLVDDPLQLFAIPVGHGLELLNGFFPDNESGEDPAGTEAHGGGGAVLGLA